MKPLVLAELSKGKNIEKKNKSLTQSLEKSQDLKFNEI